VQSNEKQRFSLIPDPEKTQATTEPVDPSDPVNSEDVSDALSKKLNFKDGVDPHDPSNYLIRANQGHSIKIDSEELLVPITEENMPPIVVHGTIRAAWPRILSSGGLKKMSRNHIHFAPGLPKGWVTSEEVAAGGSVGESGEQSKDAKIPEGKSEVISGMRNSSEVLIYVDLPKALAGGIKFWLSENGVILTEGDDKGILATGYFKYVEEANKGNSSRKAKVLFKDGAVVKE
jgi:2'-phosphotransferase